MNSNRTSIVFVSFIAILLVAGCTRALVNVDHRPIASGASSTLALSQVRDAIMMAGESLGWRMKAQGDHLIIASYRHKQHVATVSISYDTSSYSIVYRDSANLDYAPGNEKLGEPTKIHRAYNRWINQLREAIDTQLAVAETK